MCDTGKCCGGGQCGASSSQHRGTHGKEKKHVRISDHPTKCNHPTDVIDTKALQAPMMRGEVTCPTNWKIYPEHFGQSATICDFTGPLAVCDKVDQPFCNIHNPHKDLERIPMKRPVLFHERVCSCFESKEGPPMCDRMSQHCPWQKYIYVPECRRREPKPPRIREPVLKNPLYLDVRKNEMVVSERETCRLQFLKSDDSELRIAPYGKRGRGYDHLNNPGGVAYLAATGAYVVACDTGNQRIVFLKMVLDDNVHGHLCQIHMEGTGILDAPRGLCFDRNRQSFIITDVGHRDPKVTYHDLDGRYRYTYQPSSKNPMIYPTDLDIDVHGRAWVSDTISNTVSVFDRNGKYLFHIGGPGVEEGKFNQPTGVCVDSRNNVIVCDQLNNRVHLYSPDGRFIRYVTEDTPGPRGVREVKNGFISVCTSDHYDNLKYYYLYPWEQWPAKPPPPPNYVG